MKRARKWGSKTHTKQALDNRPPLALRLVVEVNEGNDSITQLYGRLLLKRLFELDPKLERRYGDFCQAAE